MIPRPATLEDLPEVIRLAAIMYGSMGLPPTESWRKGVEEATGPRLADPDLRILVIDGTARGRLAACGGATIAHRLPSPFNPGARVGYIQWVVTDTDHRRKGLARTIVMGLLTWLEREGVRDVELHATPEGDPLYRSFGFRSPRFPQLIRYDRKVAAGILEQYLR